MRTVPKDIADKLIKNIQTKGTAANPSTVAWISRPTTALTEDTFLEKQTVLEGTFTDASIAVCHPYFGATNTKLNLAYISDGVAKVLVAIARAKMGSHKWHETGFSENASAVALAYDGTMPKNTSGKYEFVTESQPWVFWVNAGKLYARKLGSASANGVILAEQNCTDVSAIRAMWSDVPGFDFGLCVFFILSGEIYYRQLIDGTWTDAVPVPSAALPTDKTWVQISAQRTWDYRVALQLVDSTGGIFEAFTQFGGIGSKGAEHIEVKDITSDGELTKVYYKDVKTDEHIEINNITAGTLYGGLYSTDIPSAVRAVNIDDGNGDYGKIVLVTFDVHIADVSAEFLQFSLIDDRGRTFVAIAATVDESGKTVILTFNNFNNARGECEIAYTAGTITSMYGTAVPTTSVNFTPTNLVPTEVILPKVEVIWNE